MKASDDSLSQQAMATILKEYGRRRRYRQGSFIVRQGEPAGSLFLLLSGSVAVQVEEESGEETMMIHLFPGEFFGELGLCPDITERSANVIARDQVELLEIGYRRFLIAAEQNTELWLAIIGQLSNRLKEVTDRVRILARHNTTHRIAFLLKELSELPDAETTARGRMLSVSRQELANMAGCTREVVSRSLQDIANAGFIEFCGRKILVTPLLRT